MRMNRQISCVHACLSVCVASLIIILDPRYGNRTLFSQRYTCVAKFCSCEMNKFMNEAELVEEISVYMEPDVFIRIVTENFKTGRSDGLVTHFSASV